MRAEPWRILSGHNFWSQLILNKGYNVFASVLTEVFQLRVPKDLSLVYTPNSLLAAPALSTLHKVSSLASGSLLLASRSLDGQGAQAYSVLF
jgi:hypothetical protein